MQGRAGPKWNISGNPPKGSSFQHFTVKNLKKNRQKQLTNTKLPFSKTVFPLVWVAALHIQLCRRGGLHGFTVPEANGHSAGKRKASKATCIYEIHPSTKPALQKPHLQNSQPSQAKFLLGLAVHDQAEILLQVFIAGWLATDHDASTVVQSDLVQIAKASEVRIPLFPEMDGWQEGRMGMGKWGNLSTFNHTMVQVHHTVNCKTSNIDGVETSSAKQKF